MLAHELGHLKCDHGVWLTVANVLASGTVSMLPVVTSMVEEALLRWLRAAELTCDRAALLVAQDPKVGTTPPATAAAALCCWSPLCAAPWWLRCSFALPPMLQAASALLDSRPRWLTRRRVCRSAACA